MSDRPEGLNLVQRAMQRFAQSPVPAPVPPVVEPPPPRNVPIDGNRAEAFGHGVAAPPPRRDEQRHEQFTPRSASRKLGSPVSLNFANLRHGNIITPDGAPSPTRDEFRNLKRRLLLVAKEPGVETPARSSIMTTSALPEEGKTFTSMNLAMSLAADRNVEVVLIDADVVKPSLQNFFTGDRSGGLTDLLKGSLRVDEALHPCVEVSNLSVIFSGRYDQSSPELMASNRAAEIFAELSKDPRRIIVVDTAPAIGSAEAAALAAHMDHTLLVVGAQQSSRHQVEEALERISSCRSVSMVFNKSPRWRKAGSAYYQYYGHKPLAA